MQGNQVSTKRTHLACTYASIYVLVDIHIDLGTIDVDLRLRLSSLAILKTPHSLKQNKRYGVVNTPARVPIADPSSAWKASRGE